jgi:uncharacterized membrane protein YfcA
MEPVGRLIAIGLLAGFFGALFGVGGGLVIVPLLVLLCGFEQRRASGTSLAAIFVLSLVGAITYASHGDVKPGAAALVGIPAVAGVLVGTFVQRRVATRKLVYGFALLLAGVGIRLVA